MPIHSVFNIALLVYLVSFPLFLAVNKNVLKGKNKKFNKGLKLGRKIHPYVGITLVISGFIHGYMKLDGKFMLHTGTLLLSALALNGIIGFTFKRMRKKKLALMHRIVGFVIVGLFLLHYINPWFFGF